MAVVRRPSRPETRLQLGGGVSGIGHRQTFPRLGRLQLLHRPPDESSRENHHDIAVRTKDDGFLAPWIVDNWKERSIVRTSDPQGYFYYEPLRDADHVVCLACGSGITPFRSMIPDLFRHEEGVRIVLFYGVTAPDEILFHEAPRHQFLSLRSIGQAYLSERRTGIHEFETMTGASGEFQGFCLREVCRR